MSVPSWRVPYVRQSLSLSQTQLAGVRRMAVEDGHGKLSRVVQDLVEAELRRRYGRNWAAEIGDDPKANAA